MVKLDDNRKSNQGKKGKEADNLKKQGISGGSERHSKNAGESKQAPKEAGYGRKEREDNGVFSSQMGQKNNPQSLGGKKQEKDKDNK